MSDVITKTELAYMSAPEQIEIPVSVVAVETGDGVAPILDRSPFYPQGGGQPSDTGTIEGEGYRFEVRKAVLADGVVHHQGVVLEGELVPGPARARIDTARRSLNSALHSGGHLIMTAVFELTGLRAVKGYHFPDGAYVEFDGTLDEDGKAELLPALQGRLDEMISSDQPVLIEQTSVAELVDAGVFMPTDVPADKPTRVVTMFGYRSPCGGTHVVGTGALEGLQVRRIKTKKGHMRVSYEFAAA